jgi:hypothetical protein
MIKIMKELGIEGMYCNIIKTIYNKPADSMLNGKKLSPSSIRIGLRQFFKSPHLARALALALAIRQKRERKGIQTGKEVK